MFLNSNMECHKRLPCQRVARLCRYVLISVGTMAAYTYSVFSIIYGRVSHGADYKASSQAAHLLPAAAELSKLVACAVHA